jgi:hypothetical protein
LLSLTAAGWVLSHGPKGNIEDGPSYWLPGVSANGASDDDTKNEAPKASPDNIPSEQEQRLPKLRIQAILEPHTRTPEAGRNVLTAQTGNLLRISTLIMTMAKVLHINTIGSMAFVDQESQLNSLG